tara:strand:- start:6668 stop:7342 length:675 start_codon:yes stop_codon:yes gene_type:complete
MSRSTRSHHEHVGYLSNGITIGEANLLAKQQLGNGLWFINDWYVEPNPKRRFHKPELEKALTDCKTYNRPLVIPKMAHLVTNRVFVEMCYQAELEGVDIKGLDLMGGEPVQMELLYRLVMNKSAKTSESVKKKMKELKEQGVELGAPKDKLILARAKAVAVRRDRAKERARELLDSISQIKKDGNRTLEEIAQQLNKRKIPSPRGGTWYPTSVANLLKLQKELI